MSGSSLYRLSALAVAIAALSILHPIYELSMGEIQWHAVVFGAITVLGSGLILQQIQRLRENVDRARQVCEAVAAGDLEARITGIEEAGPLGDMLWSVNELVDRTDSFLRESAAAMECVSRGKHYRHILDTGMRGSYRTSARAINAAVDTMGEQAAEQRRMEAEIAALITAAAAGDFTQRLPTYGKKGFMLALSQEINQLVKTIDAGLKEVVQVMGAMAEGDLTRRMERDYSGAFAQLKADSNSMADRLHEIVAAIAAAAETVELGISEISAGNTDLAARTDEQCSKLGTMVGAVEDLGVTVARNYQHAIAADSLADGARGQADDGGRVVYAAIEAMNRIQSSSERIADIVGMIDEIAFQTNLLALNASVEAAHAGEAGKGFAVVANEVRALAARSTQSSQEIRRLIGASQAEVGRGVALINDADRTLKAIIASVQKLADIVSNIASSTGEQGNALEQVALSVVLIEDITQKNAALAEEMAAASSSLRGQAEHLGETVAFFRQGRRKATRRLSEDAAPEAMPL